MNLIFLLYHFLQNKYQNINNVNSLAPISFTLNTSFNPCDDFYNYVCNNWINSNVDYPQNLFVNQGYKIRDTVTDLLLKDDPTDFTFKKTRLMFKKCQEYKNVFENKKRSYEFFKQTKELGGWPILMGKNWSEENYNFSKILLNSSEKNLNTFMKIVVLLVKDYQITIKRMFNFLFTNNKTDYKSYIKENLKLLASDLELLLNITQVENDILEIIEFEKELLEATPENVNLTFVKLSELKNFFDEVNWEMLLRSLLPQNMHYHLNNNLTIVLDNDNYLSNLSKLLKKTNKKIITNYSFWHYFKKFLFDKRFDNIDKKFDESLKLKSCDRWLSKINSFGLNALYLNKFHDVNVVKNVEKLISTFQNLLIQEILLSDFLDVDNKQKLIRKVLNLKSIIGAHPLYLNKTYINNYMNNLQISENDNFEQIYDKSIIWSVKNFFLLLDMTEFDRIPLELAVQNNFQYVEKFNYIFLPYTLIQNPFYNNSLPDFINYGRFGFFVAHEISHAINITEINSSKVQGVIDCLINDYLNQHKFLNKSDLTEDLLYQELIADNIAIQINFNAHKKLINLLPNNQKNYMYKNLTLNQIFFINFAQQFCELPKSQQIIKQYSYITFNFRINEAVKNSKFFSNTFNCSKNSQVGLQKKCIFF